MLELTPYFNHVYVSLGSNSEDASDCLDRARLAIGELPGISIAAASSLYYTEPQGFKDQPWFMNQALSLHSFGWTPGALMHKFLEIEFALGRRRQGAPRFGPRKIDIDMLLFGNLASVDAHCVLPHPRLKERAFVLLPLCEIAPDLLLDGKTPCQWLQGLAWRQADGRIYQSG